MKITCRSFYLSLMLLFGCVATGFAQEAPSVSAQANAPGWITVIWEHSGRGVTHYQVERQDPPFTWVFTNYVGKHTDMGLKAGTTYKYRVCAVDAADKPTCSPWISVTTMPPESSGALSVPVITGQEAQPDRIRISWSSTSRYGSFNVRYSRRGSPAAQVNVTGNITYGSYEARNLEPGQTYVFGVQGCNRGLFNSTCSNWRAFEVQTPLPPPPPPTPPTLTAAAAGARQIALNWNVNEAERITRTVIERDGRPLQDQAGPVNRFDDAVRPNTEYSYRVCLTNQTGTACSNVVTAIGKPVAPSALANISFTQSRFSGAPGGGLSREGARIKTVVRANWRNTETPGQFIILEREERGATGPIQAGVSWVEVKRISAKADPVEIAIELGSFGGELGFRQGTTYRVCALVPGLARIGKVCSAPTIPAQ
jgi:hypothetical protein